MNICIIGFGNIGTLTAGELAWKGNHVSVLSSKPEKISDIITVYDTQNHCSFSGKIALATSDYALAVKDAEMILITVPSVALKSIADQLYPVVTKGMRIGIFPGTGGVEFLFSKFLEKGCVVFGLQRVHSIARLKTYGQSVNMTGRKKSISAAALPPSETNRICQEMQSLFNMECKPLPNYLSITFTPSNPVLHTSRLYRLFKNYQPGTTYQKNPFFYQDWDDDSSRLLLACDAEVQQICKKINGLDLSAVASLKIYYESRNAFELTRKLKSIPAFQGLLSPMRNTPDGWVPDWTSRYFTSDFFSLSIIHEFAGLLQIHVPNIDMILDWYQRAGAVKMPPFNIQDYGLNSIDDILTFYNS